MVCPVSHGFYREVSPQGGGQASIAIRQRTQQCHHAQRYKSYKLALSNACQIGNGQLGRDYLAVNTGVVEEQLKKGGVRLAKLLNGIFG